MEGFDSIVAAARVKDIWELERWYRNIELSGNIDTYKQKLDLTPAGQLAADGEWEAAEFLMDTYHADTNNILFGAVLGGHFDEVKKCQTNVFADSNPTLKNICIQHSEQFKSQPKYKGKSPWIPIVKALAIRGDTNNIDAIFKTFTIESRCQKGVLEAGVSGFAYKGDETSVFKLLSTLDNNTLKADTMVKLTESLRAAEMAGLDAAAQGGHESLVNQLLKWNEKKYLARSSRVNQHELENEKIAQLKYAISGAIRGEQVELVKKLATDLLTMDIDNESHQFNVIFSLIYDAFNLNRFYVIEPLVEEFTKDLSGAEKSKINTFICNRKDKVESNGFILRKGDVDYLQRHYQLFLSHAVMLSGKRHLVEEIAKNTENDGTKNDIEALFKGSNSIDLLINWIKKHQPRSEFITSLENYIDGFSNTWFAGRNHIERAQSVLDAITVNTSDEAFAKLIQQQANLLNDKPAEIAIGKEEDKHNQPASRRMLTDGFTSAVFKCLGQLTSQEKMKTQMIISANPGKDHDTIKLRI